MSGNNIKVVARFRPQNALELSQNSDIVVSILDGTTVKLKSLEKAVGAEAEGFTFDKAFPMETQQVEVFQYGVKEIVDDVINGYNGTVFAYGQTGSGKTFTMMGADIGDDELKGLIPRITEQIFQSILSSPPHLEYLVKVSFFEVYMERIRDLLAPQNDNLQVHEEKQRGVYVKGLSDYYVSSAAEVLEIMRQGGSARAVSSTNMNAESSRSHSIFVIGISQRNTETGSQKHGNLYLVDLAGSEKIGKTGATGQTLEEAKKINKSLSALGNVINSLTDGKSAHIPYRDSKLTRILQESLGGNSRTTLIINCSPSSYNEIETLSTLRFGMRAKTIKNKARVNAELSPAELKALLKKAQKDVANSAAYVALLEVEVKLWRSGASVDKSEWATMEKISSTLPSLQHDVSPTPNLEETPSRPLTPGNPLLDNLKEGASRPETPSVSMLDKDEREDFLRRENELTDALAEKESALASQVILLKDLKAEVQLFRDQDTTAAEENKKSMAEVNELRIQLERMQYDRKESSITLDALREQNSDLSAEIEELRRQNGDLKVLSRSVTSEGKEKKKAEKMAALMSNFENRDIAEKEEQIRASLSKLDEAVKDHTTLGVDDMESLRDQLRANQHQAVEQQEKIAHYAEELELANRRRDDLEAQLSQMEHEYEELFSGRSVQEQDSNGQTLQTLAEARQRLEEQYAAKRDATAKEIATLKQQIDTKAQENRNLAVTVESLKGANEELKRAFAVTAAGVEGGKNLAESAKDMERIRKSMATQLSDFETMKKALMKDLQDRCEKVVELEMSLDETREQYNTVVKASNVKNQQRKMDFLTRNLDQLVSIQRQLIDQNQNMKKDIGIAEKKLLTRNERIQSLEALLIDAQNKLDNQNEKFAVQMADVQLRLKKAQDAAPQKSSSGFSFGRLAKPLRGQGTATTDHSATSAPAGRSSWFYA